MKIFSRFGWKNEQLNENNSKRAYMNELSEKEMKMIQGASSDIDESIYTSHALIAEQRKLI